jgi:nitroimidazol reductase NimA-like FMN-containing flavoprotein (pyridoxamine 5'-phosphate oxidase superfamily)
MRLSLLELQIAANFDGAQIMFRARKAIQKLTRSCCKRCSKLRVRHSVFYNSIMDQQSEEILARLLRSTRIAALGTLHEGEPNLAMVAYAFAEDFSAFYIHVSKLGKHTTDMERDPHVSLLITETDDRRPDPQTLARLSIRGTAEVLPRTEPGYAQIKKLYLMRFPEAEQLFSLGDFNLWRITPRGGRFVAGFGRAFNLGPETLAKVSSLKP